MVVSPHGAAEDEVTPEHYRSRLDAGVQAASVVLWGDFIFSGPMWGNDHVFPAVAAAHSMTSMMRYVETGSLTENEETPIHRLFPDVVNMLKGEECDCFRSGHLSSD